jgi:hypothetical protein
MSVRRGSMGLPRYFFWFSRAEVKGAYDYSCSCLSILYLAANPYYVGVDVNGLACSLTSMLSYVGADVNGLACSLHYPTVCSRQRSDQIFLTGATSSHHVAEDGGTFPGNAKPLDLYI